MDQPVGKTKHGQLTLDEIAGLQPGMSERVWRWPTGCT